MFLLCELLVGMTIEVITGLLLENKHFISLVIW